jgi:hypothetical protein
MTQNKGAGGVLFSMCLAVGLVVAVASVAVMADADRHHRLELDRRLILPLSELRRPPAATASTTSLMLVSKRSLVRLRSASGRWDEARWRPAELGPLKPLSGVAASSERLAARAV